ncbi:hypothetical protein B0H10DRAFT_1766249, partial [Mycena sp. CBHHK59/15]
RTVTTSGGASAVSHYSTKLFKKAYKDLNEIQKNQIRTAQFHDRTWRNDTSPGIMALFATGRTPCLKTVNVEAKLAQSPPPCDSCLLLLTLKAFQNTIRKLAPDPENLRYVPQIHQNSHAGMLYTKFKGLEALISEV